MVVQGARLIASSFSIRICFARTAADLGDSDVQLQVRHLRLMSQASYAVQSALVYSTLFDPIFAHIRPQVVDINHDHTKSVDNTVYYSRSQIILHSELCAQLITPTTHLPRDHHGFPDHSAAQDELLRRHKS